MRYRAITCVYDPLSFKWDIEREDGEVVGWGGDLYGALREIQRLEKCDEESHSRG